MIVRFRPGAGEDDVALLGPDGKGHVLAGLGQCLFGLAADGVERRRVAEARVQEFRHFGRDGRVERGRRVIVEINHSAFSLSPKLNPELLF